MIIKFSYSILFKIQQILICLIMFRKDVLIRIINFLKWSLSETLFIKLSSINLASFIRIAFLQSHWIWWIFILFILKDITFVRLVRVSLYWRTGNVNEIWIDKSLKHSFRLHFRGVLMSHIICWTAEFIFNNDVIVFLNVRIKSVLYSVLRSARNTFTDLRPSWPIFCVKLNYFQIFFLRPFISYD